MNRLVQLDGLRAFAVTAVMLDHTTHWDFGIQLGLYGVRLFFVLSGFLITGILLRVRDESSNLGGSLKAFYARRALRIFPVYYASLLVLVGLGQPVVYEALPWHLLYLSNMKPPGTSSPVHNHLWSLSVEEQFYLVWPTIVFFARSTWLPWVFSATVILAPVFRVAVGHGWVPGGYSWTPGCLDSLGVGAVLAWLSVNQGRDFIRDRICRVALALGVLFIILNVLCRSLDIAWTVALVTRDLGPALLFMWLVNAASMGFTGIVGRVLEWKPLVYLGVISYAVYLFHNFVPWLCATYVYPLPEHGIARFLCVFAVTIVAAAISWRYFEKPLNDMKQWFPYVRRESSPVLAQSVPTGALNSRLGDL